MHRFYSIGLEKWFKAMIWSDKKQNNLLLCQNDVVMSFVEKVNQGESLASWLNWLTEPPAVCWSLIIIDLSAKWKGVFWTLPKAFWTGPPSCAVHSMRQKPNTVPEFGFTSKFHRFWFFANFSGSWEHMLTTKYHVYIWHASPQSSCRDNSQIWMWFK